MVYPATVYWQLKYFKPIFKVVGNEATGVFLEPVLSDKNKIVFIVNKKQTKKEKKNCVNPQKIFSKNQKMAWNHKLDRHCSVKSEKWHKNV